MSKKNWEKYEEYVLGYLQSTIKNYTFESLGGSDSTSSDIVFFKKDTPGNTYNLEVKSIPSQSGQFVLLVKDKTFVFSDKNKSLENEEVKFFINHLNASFNKFNDPGTTGVPLLNVEDQAANWIVKYYKSTKKVRHIIFGFGEGINIVKIEDVAKVFSIETKYRVKKSGSSSVPKSKHDIVSKYIKDEFQIKKSEIETISKRLLVKTNNDKLQKKKFTIDNDDYMFSLKGNGEFEIRKLGKTKNANIIFSLQVKEGFENYTLSVSSFIKSYS